MSDYNYMLQQPLLTISSVSVSYPGGPVLHDCSAQVRNVVRPGLTQGQVIAILGPSGIGKTTLFNVMAGSQRPDQGSVFVTEKQVPVQQGMVGVVGQHYPLFEFWTVEQNLREAARHAGHSRKGSVEKTQAMLETFDLSKQHDLYPVQLSGGQRQRAAIAQQLLNSNSILLMDEPFSGLDLIRLHETVEAVRQVAQLDELFTIVLVTHDIGAALTVADTIWMMGRVRDEQGGFLGARVVRVVDLMERGIAWHPDNRSLPAFTETRREIESAFPALL